MSGYSTSGEKALQWINKLRDGHSDQYEKMYNISDCQVFSSWRCFGSSLWSAGPTTQEGQCINAHRSK